MGLLTLLRRKRRSAPPPSWEREPSAVPSRVPKRERRYLESVSYLLPKDGPEANRLNFQHHFLKGVLHQNYLAPISASTASIVDIGCGTGLWVREMARDFPMAQVVGVDIDLPPFDKTPPNTQFLTGNVLEGLAFHTETFAYVHQRLLVAAIPAEKWPFAVRELVRIARRGAWVELLEVGHTFENAGPETRRFMAWWQQVSHLNGFDTGLMAQLGAFLRGAGLEQVTEQTLRVPVGAWGGHSGELLKKNMLSGFEALKERYCSQIGVTPAQFAATLAALPAEWETYQTSFHFYVAYGQRL